VVLPDLIVGIGPTGTPMAVPQADRDPVASGRALLSFSLNSPLRRIRDEHEGRCAALCPHRWSRARSQRSCVPAAASSGNEHDRFAPFVHSTRVAHTRPHGSGPVYAPVIPPSEGLEPR
jgi:hypothetical protein